MSAGGCLSSGPIIVPNRVRRLRVADLFCGAGGLSTAAQRACRELGLELQLTGVNHWEVALDTHARNHPQAALYCQDLERVRPRECVPGGVLDLLIAAPSCTFHSRARGGRPVHDQQRMDPWHVVRWCTDLRVHRVLVENVPEFIQWGPCDIRTGRPIASRRGEYFRAWLQALESIGFRLDYRVLCAADYGDATTRERFMLIGCSDRGTLRWPEPEFAAGGSADLLSARARWRSAEEIIDWQLQGRSIFTRARPLAPNTLRRILAGAVRYGWSQPHVAALQALMDGRPPVLDVPPCEAASLTPLLMATASGGVARPVSSPVPTITTGGNGHGNARPQLIRPVSVSKHGGPHNGARYVTNPLWTEDTRGAGYSAQPLVAPYYGGGSGLTCTPASEPVPTVTTKGRFGLAAPFIVPITHTGVRPPHGIDVPLRTITGANRGELALIRAPDDGVRIDIHYRMLHYRELARATSLDDNGEIYDFAGTLTQITKQIGNAVPVRMGRAVIRELLKDFAVDCARTAQAPL